MIYIAAGVVIFYYLVSLWADHHKPLDVSFIFNAPTPPEKDYPLLDFLMAVVGCAIIIVLIDILGR